MKRGFSLVEMVLALGVVSFVLVSIFGLLSMSMRDQRDSGQKTLLALMTQTVASYLHQEGFAAVNADTTMISTAIAPQFYFDAQGRLATDSTGKPVTTASASNYYSCTVTRRTPTLPVATANMVYLRLQFQWPVSAAASVQNTQIAFTSLANDD